MTINKTNIPTTTLSSTFLSYVDCRTDEEFLPKTGPRREFFEEWHYPLLPTLSDPRAGILTLTDPRR